MKKGFIPVLLGSDINTYGLARSFHEQYNIKSVAFATLRLEATRSSNIIEVNTIEKFQENEVFVNTLIEYAKKHNNKELILIACGDIYVENIIKNKEVLSKYFHVPYIDLSLMKRISSKKSFYEICEKYNFPYPKTVILTKENYKDTSLPFSFPVMIKPSNSALYWRIKFEGKRKAFKADDKKEYEVILDRIYNSEYNDELIIQEFIPGDDSNMYVINCYVDKNNKVKLQAFGHVLLEEHTPEGIGSPAAIINQYNEDINNKTKRFLEDIKYTGYANFDMKYDARDNTFKFFEINLRQGRSSYFVTAGGSNISCYFTEDHIYNRDLEIVDKQETALWSIIPKRIMFKYIKDKNIKLEIRKLIKNGKYKNSLFYKNDMGFKRSFIVLKYLVKFYLKYGKYYNKRGQ